MTFLGLEWQAWAFIACVCYGARWWWGAVSSEWRAARRPFVPPPVAGDPEAPWCPHVRAAPVIGTDGRLVAELCLDCDAQLDVQEPAWP